MENDHRNAGNDGGDIWSSKRSWDAVDHGQPGSASGRQDQWKRLCLPGSLGNANTQMQMLSGAPPLLPYMTSDPEALVEPLMGISDLPQMQGPFWNNDGSGAFYVDLQSSLNSWGNPSFQPTSSFSLPSGPLNGSNELWTIPKESRILEVSTDYSGTGFVPFLASSMRDDPVHGTNNPQTRVNNVDLPAHDFLGLSKPIGSSNQQSEFGDTMSSMAAGLSGFTQLHLPTGTGFWVQRGLLPEEVTQSQLCPTRLGLLNSCDAQNPTLFIDEDNPFHKNLLYDTSIQIDEQSTDAEKVETLFIQQQVLDSFGGDSTPSSMSDKRSQMSYEYSQTESPENMPTQMADDLKYSSSRENVEFENGTLQDELTEDCSPVQKQVAQNQGTLDNVLSERIEEIQSVGYDTCFGTIRTDPVNLQWDFLGADSDVDQEITLNTCGEVVMVHHTQTLKYGGLLDRKTGQALAALSRNHSITFKALDEKSSTSKRSTSNNCRSLQITLYGLRQESNAVSDFLSENKLYLQQPRTFDSSAVYFNPQYLLRPGSEFKLAAQEDFRSSVRDKQPAQVNKQQMLRIFDSALGPARFSETQGSKRLITDLKSYQKKALAMMVEKESGWIENPEFNPLWMPKGHHGEIKRYWNSVNGHIQHHPPPLCLGGLLADEMGLGKTLTMLALIAGSIDHSENVTDLKSHPSESSNTKCGPSATLVITPLSTLSTWEDQIIKHFQPKSIKYLIYHGAEREQEMSELLRNDLVITTYGTLKSECPTNSKRKSKRLGLLHSVKWCRVVLDEAHIVRNRSSQVFRSVDSLHAVHRWCLTGTPIQNRVEDFGALVGFLRVYPFDSPTQFHTNFVNCIQGGKNKGTERLIALVQAISLRRTKRSVFEELRLGPRIERLQSVQLNEAERSLYTIMKRSWTYTTSNSGSMRNIFQTITKLRQICNHGRELLSLKTLALLDQGFRNGEQIESMPSDTDSCENCGAVVQDRDLDVITDHFLLCLHLLCSQCLPKSEGNTEVLCPVCSESGTSDALLEDEQLMGQIPDQSQSTADVDVFYAPSSKVSALLHNLRADRLDSTKDPIKSVVFTSWTKMLDLVEKALVAERIIFQRIDGGKSTQQRRQAIQSFRENPSCTVLLASIGSAGVGLDLTVASRVHLLEPQWNPMAEEQALDRVHRLGQTREVVSIRYIVKDSIEEYIMQTQSAKLDLIQASFGDGSLNRADVIEERLKNLQAALK